MTLDEKKKLLVIKLSLFEIETIFRLEHGRHLPQIPKITRYILRLLFGRRGVGKISERGFLFVTEYIIAQDHSHSL